jgi:hypothetical protein
VLIVKSLEVSDTVIKYLMDVHLLSAIFKRVKELSDMTNISARHKFSLETVQ